MKMNFNNYAYFPILRTRQAELNGLYHLSDDAKDKILPIITLGKWRNTDGVDKALGKVEECLGSRNFILDLSKEIQHQNESISNLMLPDSIFKNWLEFIEKNKSVVPVVQFAPTATRRNVVQQAVAIEKLGRTPVFRVRINQNELDSTLASLYALNAPEKALIIIDAGYIREVSTKLIKAGVLQTILNTINTIVQEVPETLRVLAGTSYPRSVTQYRNDDSETSGRISMLEHILYDSIGPDIVRYGDHASIHSVVYDDEGGTYLPKLDVPSDHYWYFERRPGTKSEGYKDAAETLLKNHPSLKTNTCWGAEMVRNTAAGNGKTINSPIAAISVRVNLHIDYQLEFLEAANAMPPKEDNGDEESWI
ncbi:beta family protein [Herbaspirillum sp. VT-16-41]|uniref:beta family protein n=1 Tax=Herbaspirillum sp. VT-16-41 TaxID=1953765 RepID=UPI0009809F9F|nr:beta family protein [Herbaspirillum sp. VT-16-41]ONN66839.1 hypothetical protein BTM36_09895 [Herbaspirillum sp. VT-16-41]